MTEPKRGKVWNIIWRLIRPILIFACACVLAIGVMATAWTYVFENYIMPPDPADETMVEFVVERGSSVSAIARKLNEEGFVRNKGVFQYLSEFIGKGHKLKAGTYELSRSMTITEIRTNKKDYLDLLLLADEQEDMIDRYLDNGTMYVLEDNGVKCECVVTDEGNGILEIKNIATAPDAQRKGYAKALIGFLVQTYTGRYSVLQVGTGDSPLTVPFYEKCGFVRSHIIPNFFTDNYDHPIYECGIQLVDMIYLQRKL